MFRNRAIILGPNFENNSNEQLIFKTVLTPGIPDTTGNIYSPLLGRLGLFIASSYWNTLGYFFAANKNELDTINPLINPDIVEIYQLPTNLYLDFNNKNCICSVI